MDISIRQFSGSYIVVPPLELISLLTRTISYRNLKHNYHATLLLLREGQGEKGGFVFNRKTPNKKKEKK